ncbi:MAG: protease inhibitor I42 family protein [Actinomycetota bacterium]|nr:protease inhibitor I42 family protein [Actinomycetota bacterium]MDP2288748.1 protease inhibitor I42 family protein [Actinomycetota bacterium]
MSGKLRILGAALAVVSVGLAVPAAGASPAPLVISSLKTNQDSTVSLKTLRTVRFEIPSNVTTGYRYEIAVPKNTAKSKVSKLVYVGDAPAMPGSGGTSVVTVKPSQAGTTAVKWTLIAPGGAVTSTSTVTLNFKKA